MSNTTQNLKEAFAGESQANRRYLAFARKAEAEGMKGIARLFRAAAEAETIHALSHLQVLGEVGSTEDNLRAAASGETYEFEQMYPGFISTAKNEENGPAEKTFTYAMKAEMVHADLFRQALQRIGSGAEPYYYVCGVCGHITDSEPADKCPICGSSPKAYRRIE
ncbi:MAG: rubrerythrin family protein [Firmicutes bacterium]|nr:rubrerythrin family protein [Bacillota bacterium]